MVVEPAYITVNIDPHDNWNVIVGNDYKIHVEVFTRENQRLYASNNLVIEINVNGEYFEASAQTSTSLSGTPLKVGSVRVDAQLIGTQDPTTGEVTKLTKPLVASAQMEIFEPIVLEPQLSVFPWDPVTLPKDQVIGQKYFPCVQVFFLM